MKKILHIVGGMTRGGVETWLMHVLRNIDRSEFQLHFLVAAEQEMAYDREVVALGGRIHRGARPRNLPRYAEQFHEISRNHGPFAAVHSHVYWYSGFVTRLGYQAGIPIRIAHSHSASKSASWKLHRRTYQAVMRRMIMQYATHRIAASLEAGKALFGAGSEMPFTVLYYGMDFTPFLNREATHESKRRLGILPERKVIGHVGRFVPVKNHAFTVDFFSHIVASGLDAHLLLVGDGPLLPAVKVQLESRGLLDRCTLAGLQQDVIPYFSAMDAFVLPSLWEGLGLVALESQAAGLPVVASSAVPEDISVIPGLVQRLPSSAGPSGWAAAVKQVLQEPRRRRGDEPTLLQCSKFGLPICLEALSGIYLGQSH